jgi:hypothetical protein
VVLDDDLAKPRSGWELLLSQTLHFVRVTRTNHLFSIIQPVLNTTKKGNREWIRLRKAYGAIRQPPDETKKQPQMNTDLRR